MALKDLVADRNKIEEESIEAIVDKYIRYDLGAHIIIFTPEGMQLSNEARLLVYLVAVEGWRFVMDQPPESSTRPSDLEVSIGIPGGSLRPILKKLKDSHFLVTKEGNYRVSPANLLTVKNVVSDSVSAKPGNSGRRSRATNSSMTYKEKNRKKLKKGKRPQNDLKGQLDTFRSEGFFSSPKSIVQLVERYHEVGIITKSSSISGMLLNAVKSGHLSRIKITENGRKVWMYSSNLG